LHNGHGGTTKYLFVYPASALRPYEAGVLILYSSVRFSPRLSKFEYTSGPIYVYNLAFRLCPQHPRKKIIIVQSYTTNCNYYNNSFLITFTSCKIDNNLIKPGNNKRQNSRTHKILRFRCDVFLKITKSF